MQDALRIEQAKVFVDGVAATGQGAAGAVGGGIGLIQQRKGGLQIAGDGVIYVTGSCSRMWALAAKAGRRLWKLDARLPGDIRPCCDVVNRGAAIYGDKVFMGTLDARIHALSKDTGKVEWKKTFEDHKIGNTMTCGPTIVKDKDTGKVMLIHGLLGDEFGVAGKLCARDIDTGEELWVPRFVEGHMGRQDSKESRITGVSKVPSWLSKDDGGKVKADCPGGGAPWQSASYDPETNTLVVGAGSIATLTMSPPSWRESISHRPLITQMPGATSLGIRP